MWAFLDWDWASFAKIVLGAGLGSATVQALTAWLKDLRIRRVQAGYMALRLATALENYASVCALWVEANESAQHRPDEQYPDWNVTLPVPLPFPDDAEGWRALDPTLASRALDFPARVQAGQVVIDGALDLSPEGADEHLIEQGSDRGLEALELAGALRQKHGVDRTQPVWDYAGSLRGSQEKLRRQQQQANEATERLRSAIAASLQDT